MNNQASDTIKAIKKAQEHLFHLTYRHWTEDVLFSFNWWFLVIVAIAPLLIWWLIVDKRRLLEISTVGFAVIIVSTFLDLIGITYSVWTYSYQVIQMLPPLNPVDCSILPCLYMLLYQWFPKWKGYVLIMILMSAFSSFAAEPLFVWMRIYHINDWRYIYSFPIYIAIGLGVKGMIHTMRSIQKNHRFH